MDGMHDPTGGVSPADAARPNDGGGIRYRRREVSRLGVTALVCSAAGTLLGLVPLLGLFLVALNAVGFVLGVVCLAVAGHKRWAMSLSIAAMFVSVFGGLLVYAAQYVMLNGQMH